MRILFLQPRVSYPPQTGLMLRNYYLARETARRGAQVTCLSFDDDAGAAISDGELMPSPESWCEEVMTVPREAAYTPQKLLRGLFGTTPVTALNYTTAAMQNALVELLTKRAYDALQIETSTLSAYLPLIRQASPQTFVLCDWHNIDSELMTRYATQAKGLPRRIYARTTARRMTDFERAALDAYDAHITCSARDMETLRAVAASRKKEVKIETIENGVDVQFYTDERLAAAHRAWLAEQASAGRETDAAYALPQNKRRLVFVGSMDYHANIDAVTHFAAHEWRALHARFPELLFTIVGRKPAPEVIKLSELLNVEVTGTVADVRPFYAEALAQIVPLRVGGGSRLKILEAMAAGVPVISTTLGAEGLQVTDGANILIADDAEQMCAGVELLQQDTAICEKLINAARQLVAENYDWSALGAALYQTLSDWRAASQR